MTDIRTFIQASQKGFQNHEKHQDPKSTRQRPRNFY
ncbi:MAG: hypothetical protein K0R24_1923 [Gammaproteobacteria bacterium]|jgi:hypothetical protein|nr:hypothetical protein [Gammaproteobacteria bacterium]